MKSATWIVLLAAAACSPAAPPAAPMPVSMEKVLFEDGHIKFVEVTNRPGDNAAPAVAYSSVIFTDAAWPEVTEAAPADALSAAPAIVSDKALPRDDRPYPWCRTEGPRPAMTVSVKGDFPQHYYRVDYKRVDGKDFGANWKTWYADIFGPPAKIVPDPGTTLAKGPSYSKEWPFDVGYSATTSAPANHTIRYQDDHIEFLEVAIREGETEHMHGHPYPSVYMDDGGFSPAGSAYKNVRLVPNSPPPMGKMTADPKVGPFPICFSAVPEAPHAVSVVKGPPQHFYRAHFKRVDGDEVKTKWQTWYPAAESATPQ